MSQQPQQQQQPQQPPPQQQQQQHPYSNHGGRGGGGRGGGGVGHGGQQQQQHFPQYGGGRGGPPQMGAWQPAYNPQGGGRPVPGYAPAMHAPHPHMGYHHPAAYSPNHFYPAAAAGAGPRGPWQQQQQPPQQQQPQPGNAYRGGVFYPAATTPGAGAPPTTPAAPPPVRERKPLVITDKDGNPIDLSKPSKAKTTTTPAPAPAAAAVTPSADAGEKMKQAALERLSAKDTTPKESAKQPEPKETPPAKVETAKKVEVAPAKVETAAPPPPPPQTNGVGKAAEPKPSSLAAAVASSPKRTPPTPPSMDGKHVYTKGKLLSFKDLPSCTERPSDLPALKIVKREEQQSDRGGGGRRESRRSSSQRNHHDGGDQWARGSAPPRNSNKGGGGGGDHRGGGGGSDWARGQAQPRQQPQKAGSRRSGRGQPPPLYDGPVAPLVKTENHWKPVKNTSALVVAEKKVKAILNKMTKEKFERLSTQMLEIPIISYETLTMMIDNVYDKAIDEPAFGDMYGDLCVRLSQMVQGNQFVHIIESDEEPPTEDGQAPAPSSDDTGNMHTVYRWSNDVSTTDAEVVGPLKSAEECFSAAFSAEEMSPIERGEMELELVSVSIRRGRFLKVMKRKGSEEEEYYVVYFPTVEAQDCGQQLSTIFLSEVECQSDASRKNSFKRSLLNKCESEFNKQDIYVDWKKDKQEYEAAKSSFTDAERSEKEGDLNFRRIKIKKQMLGNVKFIGQLYKKGLIKEKIMRYCIGSTLKLDEDTTVKHKNPEYTDSGNVDMDEEDHEAICSMFGTIGSTIDHPQSAGFMDVCFTKIHGLSQSKSLPSRSRFMYKDLIELRGNRWVPRRKEEKAKTIAEIRKDVEREERRQSQQSAQQNRGGRGGGGGDYRSGGRGGNDYRSRPAPGPARPRQPKPTTVTDDDGFTTIVSGRSAFQPKSIQTKPKQDSSSGPSKSPPAAASPPSKAVASVDKDTLEKIIKRIRSDFVNEGGNVEEVLLSWEEISGTKDAGMELVTKNADRMLDCKEPERIAICKIIVLLCEKGKVTSSDVQEGLKEVIEFIDSVVLDCPRAFEYLGDLLGQLLRIKMINMPWLCDQLSKTKVDPSTKAPFEVLKHTLLSVKSASGAEASTSFAKDSTVGQLLGDEKLKSLMESLS